jgi:hypothetical protein
MTENERQNIVKILQKEMQILPLPKPSIKSSIIWGMAFTYLIYFIHCKIAMPPVEKITGFFNIAALRYKFFESGPIPYAILFVFLFGLLYLIFKIFLGISVPLTASSMFDFPIIQSAREGDNEGVRDKLIEMIIQRNFMKGYYSSRLAKLLFRWERDRDLAAVISLKNEILENDEEDIALSFIPLTLVEWTLPLLGFLGTVIGIGGAIGGIQQGVDILFATNKLSPEVFNSFKDGFKAMALAFDTTFQGLMGLISIGILHTLFKRSLAKKLANTKSIFTNVVSEWVQGTSNEPVIIAISTLSNDIVKLNTNIEQKIAKFSNITEHVIKKADELRWLRNILYEPVVEFAIDDIITSSNLLKYISDNIKTNDWEFTTLSSTFNGSICMVGIKVLNTNHKYLFSLDLLKVTESVKNKQINILKTDYLFSEIFQSKNSNLVIGRYESRLVKILYSQKQNEVIPNINLNTDDRIFQIVINDKELLLIISKSNTGCTFSFYKFENGVPEYNFQLQPEYDFQLSHFYIDRFSNTLIAPCILKKDQQKRIYLLPIRSILEQKRNDLEGLLDQFFNLSGNIEMKQIVSFPKGIILILATDGSLYFWNREQQLKEIKDTQLSWIKDKTSRIIYGSEGSFALATTQKLFMWEVSKDGYIYPYEHKKEGLEIGAVKNINTLVATIDGRFVVGYSNKLITVWRFHQYIVDKIK